LKKPRAWKPATFSSTFSWVRTAAGRYFGANFRHASMQSVCSIPQIVDSATPYSLPTIRNSADEPIVKRDTVLQLESIMGGTLSIGLVDRTIVEAAG